MMASGACSRDLVYFTFGDAVSNAQVIQQIYFVQKGPLVLWSYCPKIVWL